jgi:hypothetical protein
LDKVHFRNDGRSSRARLEPAIAASMHIWVNESTRSPNFARKNAKENNDISSSPVNFDHIIEMDARRITIRQVLRKLLVVHLAPGFGYCRYVPVPATCELRMNRLR